MERGFNEAEEWPVLDDMQKTELGAYEQELGLVFSLPDVHNIAITGGQTANKAGVINAWKATHNPERWLNVSLPRFNAATSSISETAAEDALINQIVCQMSLAKSPKTRFRSLMKRNHTLDIAIAALTVAFVALSIFLIWIAGLLPSSRPPAVLCWLALVAWLACIGFGVFHIVRSNAVGRLLERFKLRSADIQLSTGEDDSHLERYMGDLVYLLNTNDYDTLVFDGLDTYRNLPLFERLRALCTLANAQRPASRAALRFVYLVGDGLFDDPHERTQFFDYIIPVIPYADPSNTLMLFRTGLANAGIQADDDFLFSLSQFVDDPAILRDIVNESRHYQTSVLGEEATEEDTRQLIALLTYKALFPRDFEMLQAGQGYVNALLKSRDAIVEKLQERESAAAASAAEGEEDAAAEADGYEYTREADDHFARMTLAQLLAAVPNDEPIFQNPPYAQGLDDAYLAGVLASPYLPFIKFAIRQGLIDSTYERFMTNFYSESLTSADRGLIAALAQGRQVDANRPVDNTFAVVSRIEADGIPWQNVRVFALLSHLLAYGPSDRLQELFAGVEADNDLPWLLAYTQSDTCNPAVFACMEQFLDHPIAEVLEDDRAPERTAFAHRVLAYGVGTLGDERTRMAVRTFALSDPAFLQVKATDPMRIARGLSAIEYRPAELDATNCDPQLLQYVYDHNLYQPTAQAIDPLVAALLDIDPALPTGQLVTRIFSLDETAVKHIVERNADEFMESVLRSVPVTGLHDTNAAIAWMLAQPKLTAKRGLSYLKALADSTEIDQLGTIQGYTYQGLLLDRGLVTCTPANILDYFISAGNIVDEHLAKLLEANPFPTGFTMATTQEHLGSESGFLKAVIECPHLSDEKVDEITVAYRAQFNHFDIEGVPESRMRMLIGNGVVRPTADNLNFVRRNCPGAAQAFAQADIDQYVRLVQPTQAAAAGEGEEDEGAAPAQQAECGFVRNEALEIFVRPDVDDASKVALLEGFKEPVSMSRDYSNELNAAIASRHFNVNDLPLVDELYENGNRKLKRALAEAIVAHRKEVAEAELLLSMEMVTDIAWRLRDNRGGMLSFIAQQLVGRDPEPTRLEVRTVFERANLDNYVALIDGPSALILDTPEDDALLAALQELGMAGKQAGKPDWLNRRRVNSKGYTRK